MSHPPALLLVLVACLTGCGAMTDAQRAALTTGAELIRCTPGASHVGPDRGGHFAVSGCGRQVVVDCAYVGGATVCRNPGHDREREREIQARVAPPVAAAATSPAPAPAGPTTLSSAPGFHVEPGLGGNDVLALDLLFDSLALRVRTSVEHRDQVLVSLTMTTPYAPSCTRELLVEAAGELTRYEPTQTDGAVTHFAIPADVFISFGPRVPLRMELCGNRIGFGHLEIRALRAFIAAHVQMRADAP